MARKRKVDKKRRRTVLRTELLEPRQMLAADSMTTTFDNGVIDGLNPTVEVAVNLNAGQRIAIAARSNDFDPQLLFSNSAGGQLRNDQDSGSGNDALISHYVVQSSGQYVVEVSAESGVGDFDLRIDVVSEIDLESDENNANSSISGANSLRFSNAGTTQAAEVAGTLSSFDIDLFQLGRLNAGETVSLNAVSFLPSNSTLQPFVDVVNSEGQPILDFDVSDGIFSGTVPATGDYYARVDTRVAVIDGSRFVVSDNAASWSDSRSNAVTAGKDLASIATAQQNELLYETFGTELWIGLSDSATEGTFVWSDGTPLTYTNWNGGSPSSGDFTYLTSDGEWRNDGSGNRFGVVESAVEATDESLSGKGFRSQYILQVVVTDDVSPVVESVSRLPNNGESLTGVLNTFTVNFSEDIDQSTLSDANFELRAAGADGAFGGVDDIVYGLSQSYNANDFSSFFTVTDGPLVDGEHRLTISDGVTDLLGNALDGEQDGTAGGDFVLNFTIDAVGEDVVFEGRDNETFDKSTELTFESDTVNGTGWMRSQIGVGSIDPGTDIDWWKFDALAGDSVDIFSQSNSGDLDPSITLHRLNDAGTGVAQIASDLRSGPDNTAYISGFEIDADGTYYVAVDRRFTGFGLGGYDLLVNLNRLHDIETDQNYGNAPTSTSANELIFTDIVGGRTASIAGTIMPGQSGGFDVDTFQVGFLNGGTTVTLDATSLPTWSTLEPYVELLDDDDNVITDDDLTDAIFTATLDADGTYFARVRTRTAVIDGSRFTLTEPVPSWTEAEAAAVAAGGHLASIQSAQQNQLIIGTLGANRWIGLNDVTTEGTFVWSDGSPVDYTNWALGEPSFNDYVYVSSDGRWYTIGDTSLGNSFGVIEMVAEAGAPERSGASLNAQYVLAVTVADLVPPVVSSISRLPTEGGTLEQIISTFTVNFSEDIDQSTLSDANFELRAAGADGAFGGVDDIVYGLSQSYDASDFSSFFTVTDGPLVDGEHRLTISDGVTDLLGNALDGEQDGTAGGDFVLNFTIDAVDEDVVFEGRDNETFDKSTELTFESDTVNGTGWMRSQVGVGSIDPGTDIDWWKFDALAGDSVDIFSQPNSGDLDPSITLHRLNDAGTGVAQIISDLRSGPDNTAYISGFEIDADGTYYVAVDRRFTGFGLGGYDLLVNLNRLHDIETDQNYGNAPTSTSANELIFTDIVGGRTASIAGTIMPGQSGGFDVDTFQVGFLNGGTTVTLDATSLPTWSTLEPYVELLDDDDNVITDDDLTDAIFTATLDADGTYFARVRTRTAVIDGSRFTLTEPVPSWTEAEAAAVAAGGHLASIQSAQQNQLIIGTLGANRWIGLNDVTTEGTFVWSDGSPVSYTNWALGEPSFNDYVYVSSDGRWYTIGDTSLGSNSFGVIEMVAEAGAPERSGASLNAQYVLAVMVADLVPPVVSSISRLPTEGGTLEQIISTFTVNFSEDIDQSTLTDANFELRAAGADGAFGGVDDIVYGLSQSYDASDFSSFFTVTDGPLLDGEHRLTISDGVTDLLGNALDGDRIGGAGGDYVLSFSIDAVADREVFEGRDNETFDKATELTFESDTVNGTGWMRSQIGVGSIDPGTDIDWWKFDALAGDSVDIFSQSNSGDLDPSIKLHRLNDAGTGVAQIASDLRSGPDNTAYISGFEIDADGTYYVAVDRRFTGFGLGGYDLLVNLNRLHDIETDQNYGNAPTSTSANELIFTDIVGGRTASIAGTIMPGQSGGFDVDTFQVGFLNGGTTVTLDATSLPTWSTLEPYVELLDDDDNVITDDDLTDAIFTATLDADGTYFARVRTRTAVIDGSRFTLTEPVPSWTEAEAAAVAAGGHLASIQSAQQNQLIIGTLGANRWIGLNDVTTEGTFVWSDGSPVSYTNWALGEPSFNDYVYVSSDGRWYTIGDTSLGSNSFGVIEMVAEAGAPERSGASLNAQYVLAVMVADLVPPVVSSISRLPTEGGTLEQIISTFTVNFSEDIDQSTLTDANFELRAAGADGAFGGVDDIVYGLSQSYNANDFSSFFTVTDGPLLDGEHRLTISDGVTDLLGNALDGDRIGGAGGDYVLSFSIDAVADREVFEGRDNETFDKATELTFESDTVNGTGWMRSQIGVGSIDPGTDIDWWKFDALAGDSVDIFSQSNSGDLDPSITLHRLNDAGTGVAQIASDLRSGPDNTAYISGFEIDADGTYYVAVDRRFTGFGLGGYDLLVNLNRLHDIETDQNYGNDSVVSSNQIVLTSQGEDTFIGSVAGTIMPGQSSNVDEDTFSLGMIEADNTALLTITLPPWSAIDPVIDIRNSLNEVISTQTSTNGSVVRLEITEDGIYYAAVVDRGDGDLAGQYLLQASIQPTDSLDFVDLQVTDVTVPVTAGSGEEITVSWTGVNAGAVALSEMTWSDRIYLSTDGEFGNADDVVLGTFAQTRSLTADGGSYVNSREISLPRGIEGDFLVFIETDAFNNIPEFIFEANNVGATDEFTVSQTPFADLLVSDVVAPSLSFVGEPATVTWTVKNSGAGTTGIGTPGGTVITWIDRVFVSTDGVFGNADDVMIAEISRDGLLNSGESYSGKWTGNVPPGLDGSYRWYVRSDANDAVYEFDDVLSNTSATTEVLIAPSQFADIVPTQFGSPGAAVSGQSIQVTWTTTNQGFRDSANSWIDRFYLSIDETFSGDDVLIDNETINQAIAVDGSASFSTDITLPERIEGDFHLILVVNADGGEYEFLLSDNNSIASSTIAVTKRLEPDLVPEVANSPTLIQLNVPFDFSYSVGNQGVGETVGTWIDRLYLSTDTAVDQGDLLVAEITSPLGSLPLTPSGTPYTFGDSFTIPFGFDPGTYNLLLVTDAANVELETDETNNTIVVGPLSVELPPLPDLVVTNIISPSSALSGQQIPISWTLSNQGEGAFSGSFSERILLSSDNQIGDDQRFGTFTFTGEIPAGGSVERTQLITLPSTLNENRFVVIATDIDSEVFEGDGEANNITIDDAPIDVRLQPFANLVVADVTVPADAFSGQSTGVSWTIENVGTRGTNSPFWNDAVYLSADTVFDPQFDVFLGRSPNLSFLDVGKSYRVEDFQVTLPRGINGPFYFLVIADSDSRVDEFGSEDDNMLAGGPTDVTLTPPPDLIVESIIAPATRISGETARIDWVVRNQGTGSTRTEAWNDRVYLSTDRVLDEDDRPLALITHRGELAAGATYATSAEFTIPLEVSGDFFFIVETDAVNSLGAGLVFEHIFEDNNTNASETATTIIQGALPDLEVTSVSIPTGTRSGELLAVTYTVENLGQTTTQTTSWTDAIYLSSDDQFNPAEDFFLTSNSHFGALAADFSDASRYTSTASGRIPNELTGAFFVFVLTDSRNRVLELSDDNNTGVSASTTSVTATPADFTVLQLMVPTSATSGQTFLANWSVQNVGSGSSIVTRWTDNIVLSTDDVFGNSDDIILLRRSHNGLVEAGQSYSVGNQAVEVPFSVSPGEYFVFLQADADKRVFEDGLRTNNVSSPIPLSIRRDTPDLQVTSLTTANTGEAGRPFNVEWTVTNTGGGATNFNYWPDRVFLSLDTTLSLDDVGLGEIYRTNPLSPGGSYTRSRDFAIPLSAVGEYFVLVQTDARNLVIEGAGESNNITGTPQVVRFAEYDPDGTGGDGPRPPADLVVTTVDAPAGAVGGQSVDVSWTVRNDSFSTNGEWFDSVYLSLDQVFNKEGDIYLGFADRPNDLANGESYTQSATFQVPRGLAGPYYVFVSTDGNDRIPETGSVANNVARDIDPIELVLPPLVDLAVGTITVPVSASLNQVATVSYTVSNLSTETLTGNWTDRLYISEDTQWDIGDRLFGSVEVSGPLAGNGSYSRTLEAPLPGVVPGDYHVIVRSDIRNQVLEAIEENNLAASVDQTDVDVQSLTLGVPVTSSLGGAQSLFYKLDIEEGETILFELDSDNLDAINELYISFGEVPTRATAEFSFTAALAANQRIVVPVTEAGTYYVLAYGQQNTGEQSVTIEANTIDFTVFEVGFGRGGNVGDRTISISGAKFDRTLSATLIDSEGTRTTASQIWHDTSTQTYATFDLRGLDPGFYDVEVATDSAGSVLVDAGLEVVDGGGGLAEVQVEAPSRVGVGSQYAINYSWSNDGINDAPAPFVLVGNTTPLFVTPTGGDVGLFYEFVGINENGGPAGILKPGDFGTVTLYSQASLQPGLDVPLATRQLANRDDIFDWESVKRGLRPSDISSDQYDEVFARLIENVGSTNGDILDSLARNASLIPYYLGEVPTFYELMDVEVINALADLTTSIRGEVTAEAFQIPIGGERLRFVNTSTNEAFLADTLLNGSFVVHSLEAGDYRLDYTSGIFDDEFVRIEAENKLRGVVLEAVRGVRLDIVATDESGLFLEDVVVKLFDEQKRPVSEFAENADSERTFANLRPGVYSAVIRAEGFATLEVEDIDLIADKFDLQITLLPESSISGSVVAIGSDQAAISVVAFPIDGGSASKPFSTVVQDGTFRLARLSEGTYDLEFGEPGAVPIRIDGVYVGANSETNIGTVSFVEAASVSGTVLVDGLAIIGGDAYVTLEATDGFTASGPIVDGQFVVDAVLPGTYDLTITGAESGRFAPRVLTVLTGSDIENLTLQLLEDTSIGGTVIRS